MFVIQKLQNTISSKNSYKFSVRKESKRFSIDSMNKSFNQLMLNN